MGYKIGKPIYTLSNGIDTGFFHPDPARGARFRERYGLAEGQKCVISVGHWMVRKGLPDFVELARRMPEVRFIWFGQTDQALLTEEIRRAHGGGPRQTSCSRALWGRRTSATPTAGRTPSPF